MEVMEDLTDRENQVLAYLCKGKTNMQIAEKLEISLFTVKMHVYNIFKKTKVKNRMQLMLKASKA